MQKAKEFKTNVNSLKAQAYEAIRDVLETTQTKTIEINGILKIHTTPTTICQVKSVSVDVYRLVKFTVHETENIYSLFYCASTDEMVSVLESVENELKKN